MSTGDELAGHAGNGMVRDGNRPMLLATCAQLMAEGTLGGVIDLGAVPDRAPVKKFSEITTDITITLITTITLIITITLTLTITITITIAITFVGNRGVYVLQGGVRGKGGWEQPL